MASGGFAGGLAAGFRNGVGLVNDYERTQRLKSNREKEARDQEALDKIAAAQADAVQGKNSQVGLQPIDLRNVQAAPSVDTKQSIGLSPIEPDRPSGDVAQSAGIALASGQQAATMPQLGIQQGGTPLVDLTQPSDTAPGGLTRITEDRTLAPTQPRAPAQPGQPGLSPQAPQGAEMDQALRGLTAGIREAWSQKRPDKALELMVQREKIANVNRGQAYDQAFSQYQLNGDPNAFLPFVNNHLATGLHVDEIKQVQATKDGMPIYTINGTDLSTGKAFTKPVSGGMFNSFIQGIRDPKTQQAMFAQQAEQAFKAQKALQEHLLKVDLEKSKPVKVGENERVVDGKGNVIAQGAGLDTSNNVGGMTQKQLKALQDRNKGLSSYVFKLNGVDSMQGIGDDQRAVVASTIALGEGINKLNPDLNTLGDANVAQISTDIINGKASIQPVRVPGGIGYATIHQGEQVLIPPSSVPMSIRQRFERAQGGKASAQPQTK